MIIFFVSAIRDDQNSRRLDDTDIYTERFSQKITGDWNKGGTHESYREDLLGFAQSITGNSAVGFYKDGEFPIPRFIYTVTMYDNKDKSETRFRELVSWQERHAIYTPASIGINLSKFKADETWLYCSVQHNKLIVCMAYIRYNQYISYLEVAHNTVDESLYLEETDISTLLNYIDETMTSEN